jgi:hypothetical protein
MLMLIQLLLYLPCPDCVRAVALGDALDLLDFFFRLRLATHRSHRSPDRRRSDIALLEL